MSAGHPFLEVLGEIQFSAHVSFGRIWFLAVAEQESQFSGWQSAEGHSWLLELSRFLTPFLHLQSQQW